MNRRQVFSCLCVNPSRLQLAPSFSSCCVSTIVLDEYCCRCRALYCALFTSLSLCAVLDSVSTAPQGRFQPHLPMCLLRMLRPFPRPWDSHFPLVIRTLVLRSCTPPGTHSHGRALHLHSTHYDLLSHLHSHLSSALVVASAQENTPAQFVTTQQKHFAHLHIVPSVQVMVCLSKNGTVLKSQLSNQANAVVEEPHKRLLDASTRHPLPAPALQAWPLQRMMLLLVLTEVAFQICVFQKTKGFAYFPHTAVDMPM